MNLRFKYFILSLASIGLGLASRSYKWVEWGHAYVGDALYAVFIYFGFRFLFPNLSVRPAALVALFFCFAIEFQQMIPWEWLRALRSTTVGHLILGQGFLWSDILAYSFGVFVAQFLDHKLVLKDEQAI
ncbi:DUF2809 domain-containing protein [Croceimicrobium sp.]|uniref:ribosomal maturation YjgA family protein n=1 Tax=Croceimicrobium sp. TaxID=2828340 RepID=UPI003BA972DB